MENKKLEIGEQIETTVLSIGRDCVFLELDPKSDGIADISDFKDKDGNLTINEGDKVKVFFVGLINGEMRFTAKIAGDKADAQMIENAYKSQIPVEGHVEKEIKGGYEIKIGQARAFCPYSQMGFRQKEEASYYVGRVLPFIITEYKNDGKDLLVSNRIMGEREYNEKKENISKEIIEGAIVEGVVESVQNFGAFVTVNGFKTLLPISEIQFDRVDDIFSIISEGQKIRAKVLKTDWAHERVSISVKALLDDPWTAAIGDFEVGKKYDGKISRVADFGVFVNLAKGIDGLVHISALENVGKNTNIKKLYNKGDLMSVVIQDIDVEAKRMSLVPASSVEQDLSAAKYMSAQDNDDDGDSYNPFANL